MSEPCLVSESPATPAFVAASAIVEDGTELGDGSMVWHRAHVRRGARVGAGTRVGGGAFIDAGVRIGRRCKIQSHALLFAGTRLEDGVFVGPAVCITNDRFPRAVTPDGTLKDAADWEVTPTVVGEGASLGAMSTLVAGVRIGAWSMIAAGAVVTRDVARHALVAGVPARQVGWVCRCGHRLDDALTCGECARSYTTTPAGLELASR